MRELTYSEAALEAVAEEMRRDPKIFYMSTDALPPLLKEFGPERIRATPITEAAFTGMAIGAALGNGQPSRDGIGIIHRLQRRNNSLRLEDGSQRFGNVCAL